MEVAGCSRCQPAPKAARTRLMGKRLKISQSEASCFSIVFMRKATALACVSAAIEKYRLCGH